MYDIVVSDNWCGVVSSCPIREGDNVIVGCYGFFDWLSYFLQYNPITTVNASIEFLDHPSTFRQPTITDVNQVRINAFGKSPFEGPEPELLLTTYTKENIALNEIINVTCKIRFDFSLAGAYSERNKYANNSLEHICSVQQRVSCEYYRFIINSIYTAFCY